MQAGRPLNSVEFIPTAAGTMRMPTASKPFSQTSPCRKVFIGGDRPIVCTVVFALDLEVVGEEPRKIGEVMQRRSAYAPTRLVAVAEGILAFEQEGGAGRLHSPSPNVRADEIGHLPVRP